MAAAIDNIPGSVELLDSALESQMVLSMGPQHPSTHGVLRLDLRLDGELIVKAIPDIGYLHTGMEKLFEYKKYQQGIVITDRMDYLNPLGNNLAYVMAAEKLLQIEIPERAQVIRVLFCELQRIASHLVWLGTHALDIGAMSVFFFCFRHREKILNLIEAASGGRMTPSYFRIGGLMMFRFGSATIGNFKCMFRLRWCRFVSAQRPRPFSTSAFLTHTVKMLFT